MQHWMRMCCCRLHKHRKAERGRPPDGSHSNQCVQAKKLSCAKVGIGIACIILRGPIYMCQLLADCHIWVLNFGETHSYSGCGGDGSQESCTRCKAVVLFFSMQLDSSLGHHWPSTVPTITIT
eukprot:4237087-Amphidinium_carterae.1